MNTPDSIGKVAKAVVATPGPGAAVDAIRLVVESANEWMRVQQEQKTERQRIDAWESTQLAVIHTQRDYLLNALDCTFDERAENFRRLFDTLDTAMTSNAPDSAARVADVLGSIDSLAQSSPFKDLKSPEMVVQEFLGSGKAIEL